MEDNRKVVNYLLECDKNRSEPFATILAIWTILHHFILQMITFPFWSLNIGDTQLLNTMSWPEMTWPERLCPMFSFLFSSFSITEKNCCLLLLCSARTITPSPVRFPHTSSRKNKTVYFPGCRVNPLKTPMHVLCPKHPQFSICSTWFFPWQSLPSQNRSNWSGVNEWTWIGPY